MFKLISFVGIIRLLGCTVSDVAAVDESPIAEDVQTTSQSLPNIRSVYTSIEPDSCQIIKTNEEDGSSLSRCPGYNNIPVFLEKTQSKDYISIDSEDNFLESPPSNTNFNSLGDKIEWRLKDDKPFAAIYRHHIVDPPGITSGISSYLGVIKIGTEKEETCVAAFISGNIPNHNQIARDYVDGNIDSFICGQEQTETIAN